MLTGHYTSTPPRSKVVQICTGSVGTTYLLCEDGSVWQMRHVDIPFHVDTAGQTQIEYRWVLTVPVPIPPVPTTTF